MPGKDNASAKCNSTFYVNPELEIVMEDTINGKPIVKMCGDPNNYILCTKKFRKSKIQKYNGLLLFGKYPEVFHKDDEVLSEIAKGIIGW
jgi:hypothetical protein